MKHLQTLLLAVLLAALASSCVTNVTLIPVKPGDAAQWNSAPRP